MKKRLSAILIMAVLLVMLGGCFLENILRPGNNGSLDQVRPLQQELSFIDDASITTAYWQVYGDTKFTFNPGDGSPAKTYVVDGRTQISHDYDTAGDYDVRFTEDGRIINVFVIVKVKEPIVRFPFFLKGDWDVGQRIMFNIPERRVGCDGATGDPLYVTGITPGSGVTEFRMTAYDYDGKKVPLFDSAGDNVWGLWIPLADVSDLQTICLWFGWYSTDPMGPTTMSMSYGDADDWVVPEPEDDDLWVDVYIEGRNQWMSSPYPKAQDRFYYGGGCI